jgi:hypothetical protein
MFVGQNMDLLKIRGYPIAFDLTPVAFLIILFFGCDMYEVRVLHTQPKNWSAIAALLSTAYIWIFFVITIIFGICKGFFGTLEDY